MTDAQGKKSIGPDDASIAALIELLGHQRTLYRRLRVLAERQRALVAADEVEPLIDVLAERQTLVDALVALNNRLAPYRRNWTEVYNRFDRQTRRTVSEMLEEANSTLGLVLRNDGQDCGTLSARRETTALQISSMNSGGRARSAYASAGIEAGYGCTDTRG